MPYFEWVEPRRVGYSFERPEAAPEARARSLCHQNMRRPSKSRSREFGKVLVCHGRSIMEDATRISQQLYPGFHGVFAQCRGAVL